MPKYEFDWKEVVNCSGSIQAKSEREARRKIKEDGIWAFDDAVSGQPINGIKKGSLKLRRVSK